MRKIIAGREQHEQTLPGTKRMPVDVIQRIWKSGEEKENRS